MADAQLLDILGRGQEGWSSWRLENASVAMDLTGANLAGVDLSSFDLHGVNLGKANLRRVIFKNADLEGATLREADLTGADLSAVGGGLKASQLAGTDLTSALLPETIAKTFQSLDLVKNISESAQKLFVAALAACLYCWLTIGTTSDLNLVTNRATSALPIIQTSIPIVGFYFVAPVLLLLTFFYFHFYLQKLWEELGSLPAVFQDGLPLSSKAAPWLLNDLVRSHIARLKANRPFMSYAQEWISVFLAWWVVPITLIVFWVRYLRRHDIYGSVLHSIVIVAAIVGATFSYRLAGKTLQGVERRQLRWRASMAIPRSYAASGIACVLLLLMVLLSNEVIHGRRSRTWDGTWWKTETEGTWLTHAMRALGYSAFADLRGREISVKPANWDVSVDTDYRSIVGAELNAVDLRESDLTSAFLARAVLNHAHLEDANLLSADLTRAQLIDTHLERADLLGATLKEVQGRGIHLAGADLSFANLSGAKLESADLSKAILTGANLSEADLTYAHLEQATVTGDQLKSAAHIDLAYLSADQIRSSQMDENHNLLVKNKEDQEKIHPKDTNSDELARLDSLSGLPGGDAVADGLRGQLRFRAPVVTVAPAQAGSSKSFSVKQLADFYKFPDLDGRGQTIGIIELGGGFSQANLANYFAQVGLKAPRVVTKLVDGAQNSPSNADSADGEVQQNIEIAGTVAPGAKIVVYFSPNTDQGYVDAVAEATHDVQNRPTILMTGWGGSESTWTKRSIEALNNAIHEAADAGITFLAAVGDSGATDGVMDGNPHVDFPASSPWALAVGGTTLKADGTSLQSEGVWNSGSTSESGRGISSAFPPPEWQKNMKKAGRRIPDVSVNASPESGYQVLIDGKAQAVGGTSAAVSMWAGLVALLNQGLGKNLGHFNPVLYRTIGASGGFNPVPRGPGIPLKPGWTPEAGWGTPDGKKLLAALLKKK